MNMETAAASDPGAGLFRRAMNAVYWRGAVIARFTLVRVSASIPLALNTRYVLNSAASWPEPLAVLLTVGITFIGAANCYRQRIHMNMTVGTDLLPPRLRAASAVISELLMGVMAIFILVWGMQLAPATRANTFDEFPWLYIGLNYLPILLACSVMFLFFFVPLT